MTVFHLVEGDPHLRWVIEELHSLQRDTSREIFGADETVSVDSLAAYLTTEVTCTKGLLLAIPGPALRATGPGRLGLPLSPAEPSQIVGAVKFTIPERENQHLLEDVFIWVAAPSRRQGIGSALLDAVLTIAAERGRDTILMWSDHSASAVATGPEVAAVTGSGSVPADTATSFAQAKGFTLAQVERQSRLDLPLDPALLATLEAQAEAAAGSAYRLVSWRGPTPDAYLAAVAAANQAVSADAPSGDLDVNPQAWDASRVSALDDLLHRTGNTVTTVAIATESGEAVGFTRLFVESDRPRRAFQQNTVVMTGHRGHRLGLWLKTANLGLLRDAHPQVTHVDTWNADENQQMLAINNALGNRLWALSGAWQLKTAVH